MCTVSGNWRRPGPARIHQRRQQEEAKHIISDQKQTFSPYPYLMYLDPEAFHNPDVRECLVPLPVCAALAKPLQRDFASITASAPGAPSIKPMPEKALKRADNDDGFVTVQRRKRRLRTNKNRCGKAPPEPEVSLRAAKPNTPVYISRLHYTTKAEDIVEYVRQRTTYMPRVQLLESHRNVNFKAFIVRVPNLYLPVVMEEDFWPQDVVFRRFRGQVPQDSTKCS